jgi:hypothetical protein
MDRRLIPPTIPLPPLEYSSRYMRDLVYSLNDLITILRTPGLGRNTTTTFTNPALHSLDLERGTVWNEVGYARLAGYGPTPSISPSIFGQMSKTTDAVITGITPGAYKSTGVVGTLDAVNSFGISAGLNDTFALRNTSGAPRRVVVYASIDAHTTNPNQQLGIKLALNGFTIDETECRACQINPQSEAKLVTRWIVGMDDGDEIAVYITNHTSNADVTFRRGRIVAA